MNVDFSYQISDERLVEWAAVPPLVKLHMLDNLRLFTLAMRAAPAVDRARFHSDTSPEAQRD